MKKLLLGTILACACGLAAPMAAAVPITSADLDQVKAVVSKTDLSAIANAECGINGNGNSTDAEACWANDVLGLVPPDELNVEGKEETVAVTYVTVGTASYGTVIFGDMPSYYIIKNANAFALMDNSVDPGRAVFDWNALNAAYDAAYSNPNPPKPGFNLGDVTVSHVTRFSGGNVLPPPPVDVPEPAALALFGIGIVGFGIANRRRRRSTI